MQTYSLDQAASMLVGDTMRDGRRWLVRQISAGRIPAVKTGRTYRMTQAQIERAVEVLSTAPTQAPAPVRLGPTAASLRRRRSA